MADETKPETPEAKKDGPDYRPTKQIPKVEIQQSQFSELKSIMTEGFSKVDTAIFELGERVIRVEIRQKDLEERMGRHSGGTRQLSENDGKQDALLGTVVTKVDALEKKTDSIEKKTDEQTAKLDIQTQMMIEAKEAASKVWKDPKFRLLMGALWTALLIWLGKHGIEIKLP
jgi:hypothetical protein